MKKGTKIVIGAIIAIILLIVLTIWLFVGGFFTFVYFTDKAQKRAMEKREQAEFDGREFGKTTDQNGCMEKGFSFPPPEHYFANMNISGFVSECLKSSRPVPNFCDGVPTYNDTSEERDKWKEKLEREKCPEYPNNEPCSQTIYGKQSFCSYGTGLKKSSDNTNRQIDNKSEIGNQNIE